MLDSATSMPRIRSVPEKQLSSSRFSCSISSPAGFDLTRRCDKRVFATSYSYRYSLTNSPTSCTLKIPAPVAFTCALQVSE
jgi:hypothetical protein